LKTNFLYDNIILQIRFSENRRNMMPDMNDFHAFRSTTDGDSSAGCGTTAVIWAVVIAFIIWLIGKI